MRMKITKFTEQSCVEPESIDDEVESSWIISETSLVAATCNIFENVVAADYFSWHQKIFDLSLKCPICKVF